MPFMQHHMCLSPRIRMETSLWRYCKPSKRGLQGGITHSPELLQLHNMLCLYFSAPLIYQSNDSANRLRILVSVSRIYQARLLVSLAISVLAETQIGEHVLYLMIPGIYQSPRTETQQGNPRLDKTDGNDGLQHVGWINCNLLFLLKASSSYKIMVKNIKRSKALTSSDHSTATL